MNSAAAALACRPTAVKEQHISTEAAAKQLSAFLEKARLGGADVYKPPCADAPLSCVCSQHPEVSSEVATQLNAVAEALAKG